MSLRRAGRMHHLGVGAKHARKRVLALADEHHITVTDLTTGEILSQHLIEPEKADPQATLATMLKELATTLRIYMPLACVGWSSEQA